MISSRVVSDGPRKFAPKLNTKLKRRQPKKENPPSSSQPASSLTESSAVTASVPEVVAAPVVEDSSTAINACIDTSHESILNISVQQQTSTTEKLLVPEKQDNQENALVKKKSLNINAEKPQIRSPIHSPIRSPILSPTLPPKASSIIIAPPAIAPSTSHISSYRTCGTVIGPSSKTSAVKITIPSINDERSDENLKSDEEAAYNDEEEAQKDIPISSMSITDLISSKFKKGRLSKVTLANEVTRREGIRATKAKKRKLRQQLRRRENGEVEEEEAAIKKVKANEDIEEEKEVATPPSNHGPKLLLVDGKIQIDENSLFIQKEQSDLIDIDESAVLNQAPMRMTASSFRDQHTKTKWDDDTLSKFYEGLSYFGTDFTMISIYLRSQCPELALLPEKDFNRKHCKYKYGREEKKNGNKITLAQTNKKVAGPDIYDKMKEAYKPLLANASELSKSTKSEPKSKKRTIESSEPKVGDEDEVGEVVPTPPEIVAKAVEPVDDIPAASISVNSERSVASAAASSSANVGNGAKPVRKKIAGLNLAKALKKRRVAAAEKSNDAVKKVEVEE